MSFAASSSALRRSCGQLSNDAMARGVGNRNSYATTTAQHGVHVEVQHHVPEVGWVDLLIGGRLVLELDSRDHHTGESNYESDRTRDRKLVAQGYLPMRVTYGQVFRTWDSTYRHPVRDRARAAPSQTRIKPPPQPRDADIHHAPHGGQF